MPDEQLNETPFYIPAPDSPEITYLRERRQALGGPVPARSAHNAPALAIPPLDAFAEFLKDSGDRDVSTTMAYVRLFSWLLRDPTIGKFIVPIIPDEARTFGMEALFRQCGIYSSLGQNYVPVDAKMMLYYKEAKDGQILEEGINEAGAISSFIAAGTAYANHGINMIPFYIYYSMFGFQRIGDFIWAAADSRCKGFLLGGTAGRTTLAGEGLQHQDGHTPIMAATVPNLLVYDPAYAYETTVIIQDGLRRMYQDQESIFYYLTLYNENYLMPGMPEGVEEGILRGMYLLREKTADIPKTEVRPQLFGSGTILREVLRAQDMIADEFGISSDAWSITSYKELRRDALDIERSNLLNPAEPARKNYVEKTLAGRTGPYVAATDYMRLVPEQIARWLPGNLTPLGTDGFGRSDTRENLRRHFEVDAEHIAYATICALAKEGAIPESQVLAASRLWKINPEKLNPLTA
jgi:pyruvate dehydrogenase E1 component